MMKLDKEIGLYVGGELISTLRAETIEKQELEKYSFEMEFYMRRKNKFFLRTKHGQKLTFEVSELTDDLKGLKYGTPYRCEFNLKPEELK